MRHFVLSPLAIVFAFCLVAGPLTSEADIDPFTESPAAFDQRMAWWRDATFGMFIHWGPYAVPAGIHNGEQIKGIGEWIMHRASIPVAEYEEYALQFDPVAFDADEWVRIAKDAGMRYIIITSKHHDGFSLWDSDYTEYDSVDFSPIGRDLLGELKAACDRQGMVLGFYHSIMDWHHPDAQAPHYPSYSSRDQTNPNFDRYVETKLKPQVQELIEKYDPAVIWFDGEWVLDWTHELGLEMYAFCRDLKPDILVNNRVDKGRQGMEGMNRDDMFYAGDFGTPEQEILEGTSDFDWESCMTMNNTWGYKSYDHDWKSTDTLIHNLIDVAAKGGNYLLNVGPTAEGIIPAPSVDRLTLMGAWLRTNGEAIYGTERLEQFKEGETLFYTRKPQDRTIYATLTEWPEGDEVRLTQVIPDEGSEIHLLGYALPLEWRTEAPTTVITLPGYAGPVDSQTEEPTTTITLPGYTRPLEWQTEGPTTVITLPAAARASSEHAWVLRFQGQEVVD